MGGSHHQKVVVIDDQLAFAGGLDLTLGRWDTPDHVPDDPRRIELNPAPARPYHDVQVAVSGAAARALGELARERWRCATGKKLRAPTRWLRDSGRRKVPRSSSCCRTAPKAGSPR